MRQIDIKENGINIVFQTDSIGQGLLEHEQAYLKWIETYDQLPLIIE
ncbi:MAG TPA: hypothetical protein VHP81_00105 [Lachnospiraceae bacterium]|nr:hypothetical protein [Lachnospiraceae bacterium]